jgi:copper transport protein
LRYRDVIMTARPRPFARVWRGAIALVAGLFVALAAAGVASAHTDFVGSTPSDGDEIDGPLEEIVVEFTNPAVPSGAGFEVLGPDGALLDATLDPTDGRRFVLTFDPALGAGEYGVRWEVRAGDAHPLSGSFRFTVLDDANGSTTAATATTPMHEMHDTAAAHSAAGAAATGGPTAAGDDGDDGDGGSLDEFLAGAGRSDDGSRVGRFGRIITFTGLIVGAGALAALWWVVRGSRDELRAVLSWVRLAGAAIATGGVMELAALQATTGTGFGDLVDTEPGIAAVGKIIGGVAIWIGFHRGAGELVGSTRSLSAAVVVDEVGAAVDTSGHHDVIGAARWVPTASAAVGLAGYAVVFASFWFDGHTASRGPWAVHALADLVHLGAASLWAGGVATMTFVAWARHRRGERAGLGAMIIRFSTLAAISLAAVVAAGLVMTFLIIDGIGDLTSTDWGRLLLVKVGVVATAAAMGAYNHFRLRPALEARPDDVATLDQLRWSLTIESAVFGVVIVLSAVLVAAAV